MSFSLPPQAQRSMSMSNTRLSNCALYRVYYTAGYNIAHIDVTAKLCEENNIRYQDVDRVEAVVNWLETQYPSPAFTSRREDGDARIGGTAYFTAYGVVKRGYPVTAGQKIDPKDAPIANLTLQSYAL